MECPGDRTFLQRGSPPPPPWRLSPGHFVTAECTPPSAALSVLLPPWKRRELCSPSPLPLGESIPRTSNSLLEPLNRGDVRVGQRVSPAPPGGLPAEERGGETHCPMLRFMDIIPARDDPRGRVQGGRGAETLRNFGHPARRDVTVPGTVSFLGVRLGPSFRPSVRKHTLTQPYSARVKFPQHA